MTENVVMSLSMLPMLFVVDECARKSDYWSAFVVFAATGASMMYHFVENQKHQMPGIASVMSAEWSWLGSKKTNAVLINVDRACALALVLRFASISISLPAPLYIWLLSFALLFVMFLSEVPLRHNKYGYMFLHCIWHVGGAFLLYHIVSLLH